MGKRIEARALDSHIERDPEWHHPSANEIALEPWEQLAERTLSAGEQRVNVPTLGDPGSSSESAGSASPSSTSTRSK
jgi:hypothetical protein